MVREMKDSGVPWIGEIPSDWDVSRLKSVAICFSKGNGITKEDVLINGDTPCVRYGEIYSKYNQSFSECVTRTNKEIINPQKYFSYGDILFTCTGELVEEIGKSIVYLGNDECLAGGDIIILKHTQNPTFLNYALNSTYAQAQKSCSKTKLKVVHISATEIGNIIVALPTIVEQQTIAEYLDKKCAEIDAVLDKIRLSIEAYKKLRQAIITQAVTKGIRGDRPMKDSGVEWIPSIPTDWNAYRGKCLFRETNERSEAGDEELLTVSHITGITPRSQKNVNMFMSESLIGYKVCHVGDIAANTMWMWQGAIGVSSFEGVISPSYNTYRQTTGAYESRYLDYLLRIRPLIDMYSLYSTGITASRLRLYPEQFSSLRFIVPPLDEQKEIADYLDSKIREVDSLILKKELYIAEIEAYKKSLIFEYVTGKKEVV